LRESRTTNASACAGAIVPVGDVTEPEAVPADAVPAVARRSVMPNQTRFIAASALGIRKQGVRAHTCYPNVGRRGSVVRLLE
jgi:hypothetical protein